MMPTGDNIEAVIDNLRSVIQRDYVACIKNKSAENEKLKNEKLEGVIDY